jgi:hypothetical protein
LTQRRERAPAGLAELLAVQSEVIAVHKADQWLSEIDRPLPAASPEAKDALIQEKRRLMGEIQSLGSPRWKGFKSPRSHTLTEDT